MNLPRLTLAAVGVLLAAAPPAAADTIFDVEAARANARAGGPTNVHDAELLNRYGALSGRGYRVRYSERLEDYAGYADYAPRRSWRHHHGRRVSRY